MTDQNPATNGSPAPAIHGAELLQDISNFIARYLQCTEHQRTVLALWVLHTYCFYTAQVTPYLSIRSAEKQSGKTLCLQLLALLCDGSALTSGGFRASDLARPTELKACSALLLDECHATVGTRSRNKAPGLRALFSGSFHLLHGHSNIAEERSAFLPKAFAGLSPLPQDLAERSIPIILSRFAGVSEAHAERESAGEILSRAKDLLSSRQSSQVNHPKSEIQNLESEIPERLNLKEAAAQVLPLRSRLHHWADKHLLPFLDKLSPLPRSAFPPNLSPRQQDMIEPLLLLAGALGGPWSHRALEAFTVVFEIQTIFDLQPNLQLLADVRDCFAHHNFPDRLATTSLIDWIYSLPDRSWDADGRFTSRTLARLLGAFDIHPRPNRMNKDKDKARVAEPGKPQETETAAPAKFARGYLLADFLEPWQQYLSFELSSSQVADQKRKNTSKNAGCDAVTLAGAPAARRSPLAPFQPLDHQKSEIETQKSQIPEILSQLYLTCSTNCEQHLQPENSSQSIQQLQKRKRELLALLTRQTQDQQSQDQQSKDQQSKDQKPQAINQESETTQQEPPIGIQKSQTLNLAPAGAKTVPAPASNQKPEIENQKSEAFLQQEARLKGVYITLKLQGTVDVVSLARSFQLEDLKARMDWVNAHNEWFFALRHGPAEDFAAAFRSINP